jgi:hypothetical protein
LRPVISLSPGHRLTVGDTGPLQVIGCIRHHDAFCPDAGYAKGYRFA